MKKLNLSYFGVILSEAVRRSRRLSLVFSLLSLVLLTACTDYVSQIEDRYGEWNGVQDTEPVEVDPYVIIKSSSSSTEVTEPVEVNTGSITDSRDGQSYKTVVIGSQTWMAQNLNYETANSYCFGNTSSNCSKYGRLYTWAVAKMACPTGWHLPTKAEFEKLFTAVGGQLSAGKMLKSTTGWNSNGSGLDIYSFSALPSGRRGRNGSNYDEGVSANFWTSTEYSSDIAYYMYLLYLNDGASLLSNYDKYYAFSVRCVQD